MPALRAVLDTNVLLSGIAYPASVPGRLITAWKHGALQVVLSQYILTVSADTSCGAAFAVPNADEGGSRDPSMVQPYAV